MSLLHQLVCLTACPSTHHRLAMDALLQLRCPNADGWRELFLNYYEPYLRGAKAPDDEFQDFKNHVLHVRENYWGGATAAAQLWYERLVLALRKQYWADAVFMAGVLSHYISDTLMPLHTGQSEEAGRIHRAAEWSIAKSYDELQEILEHDLGGYPAVVLPEGKDWLTQLLRRNAELAHPHYQVFLDHYHLAKGLKDPAEGLDQELKDRVAALLGQAAVSVARVLDRAFVEAGTQPPMCELVVETVLALAKMPYRWLMQRVDDAEERELVELIFDEVQRTGKVIENLPEDDQLVRKLHADQVLKITLKELDARPARPTGLHHGRGKLRRDPVPDSSWSWFGSEPAAEARPLTTDAAQLLRQATDENRSTLAGSLAGTRAAYPVRFSGVSRSTSNSLGRRRLPRRGLGRRPLAAVSDSTLPPATNSDDAAPERDLRPTVRRTVEFRDDPPSSSTSPREEQVPDSTSIPPDESPESATPPEAQRPRRRVGQLLRGVASRVAAGYNATAQRVKKLVRRKNRADAPQALADGSAGDASAHAESNSESAETGAEQTSSSRGGTLRFNLELDGPVEDAPAIGPKMAKRLEGCDVRTVADLLSAAPENIAAHLGIRAITSDTVVQWQRQAELVCRVPNLRGHDAQILVACGVSDAGELAGMDPASLFELIEPFLRTREADQILRGSPRPDLDEVADWIDWSQHARANRAA